jgi:hypothetical protein
MSGYITENERQTPIFDEVDIAVAGGGTAGTVAAIAAAQSGMRVLIIEQFGSLGGSSTNGMVTPHMSIGIPENPLCSSVGAEIDKAMVESGFGAHQSRSLAFDPEMLKFTLESIALERGVKILYYTLVSGVIKEDGKVTGLIVENKAGRSAILAKTVIDCSGDGDICVLAGVPYDRGNPDNGKNQAMSVRYMMSGVDIEKFVTFIRKYKPDQEYRKPFFHTASVWGGNGKWPLEPLFKKALDAGDITREDGQYWQVFGVPGKKDVLAFNCPEIFDRTDGTSPLDLTEAQIYSRKAIQRLTKFYKKYFEGFENAYVSAVAPMVGVRESRRIKCRYTLQDDDVFTYRKFPDGIVQNNYPLDVHGFKGKYNEAGRKTPPDGKTYYEIPYLCLVPVGVKALLVAGRCISASFAAQSSLRVMVPVRALGEAAGIAAAMSIKQGVDVSEINGEEVRREMIRCGADFV